MEYKYLQEPLLDFAFDSHICPRLGIARYSVYDASSEPRRDDIYLGVVGINENIDLLKSWLQKVSGVIPAKPSNHPNLFQPFIGFNKLGGFKSKFILADNNIKILLSKEIREIMKIKSAIKRIEEASKLYGEKIKFLAQNKTPEVIVCIIPDNLYSEISTQKNEVEDQAEDHLKDQETNFRRLLKAEVMRNSNVPIQIIRENTLRGNPEGRGSTQDDATTAWNLCTALYYKSSNTKVPWKVNSSTSKSLTCYVGISFFRSRDETKIYSSLAQIFDEMGRNVILRGTPVNVNKEDRRPYLDPYQAHDL